MGARGKLRTRRSRAVKRTANDQKEGRETQDSDHKESERNRSARLNKHLDREAGWVEKKVSRKKEKGGSVDFSTR